MRFLCLMMMMMAVSGCAWLESVSESGALEEAGAEAASAAVEIAGQAASGNIAGAAGSAIRAASLVAGILFGRRALS